MTTVYLKCTGANLRAQVHGEITAGMRGIAVEISFDEAWQGLTTVLVVDCAETVKKMAVDAAGHSSIPWECCISGELLKVGLCGLNADGTVKLPTVWVSCGKVLPSTDDVQAEESSAPPTPGLLEQIAALANQAQTAAHAVTEAAQQGKFNGQDGTTPNIQIGNVTTVSSGTPAAVRRRGTDENPVLDFDIPKGEDAQGNGLVVDPEAVPAPPPETLPLDKTLSQPDQAAEALATGIAVGSLASRVSTLESKPQIPPSVELRLKKLEAAAEGNLYMFWEDGTEGYSKTVPDDAMLYAELDKIGGRTVVRNQTYIPQVKAPYTALIDDAVHFYGKPSENFVALNQNLPLIAGHIYIFDPRYSDSENYSIGINGVMVCIRRANTFSARDAGALIFTATAEHTGFATRIVAGTNVDGLIAHPTLIDLTQWLGAEIADTITSPEQAYALGIPREPIPYDEGMLVGADVERVITGAETKEIPAAIRSLPGYGWSAGNVYNEVDYANKQYVQRVGCVNLGSLNWLYYEATAFFNVNAKNVPDNMKYTEGGSAENWICAGYEYKGSGSTSTMLNAADMTIYNYNDMAYSKPSIRCKNRNYTTASEFAKAMSGVMLYYELAEPIVTDISGLLPDGFENIKVEAGGTITFRQSGSLELPVPNQETYMIKLGGGNT